MIVTATIHGVHCEIHGTPEECHRFIDMAFTVPKIEYGRSAVEEIVKSMAPENVCDPMARHTGNCGAEDCPIIGPAESLERYRERIGRRKCPHPIAHRYLGGSVVPYCMVCGLRERDF